MRTSIVWIALLLACISSAGCSLIVPSESSFTPDLDTGVFPFDAGIPVVPSDASAQMDASAPDAAR